MTPNEACAPTHATIANHILKSIWYELGGVYAPGSLVTGYQLGFRPGELLVRTGDGHVIEVSAGVLPSDDPRVKRLADSAKAIDAGDVE